MGLCYGKKHLATQVTESLSCEVDKSEKVQEVSSKSQRNHIQDDCRYFEGCRMLLSSNPKINVILQLTIGDREQTREI